MIPALLAPAAAQPRWAAGGPGNSDVVLIEAEAPAGDFLNSQGGNDAVQVALRAAIGAFGQGPAEQPRYCDTVVGLGANLSASWTAINPAMPVVSSRIESKFAQGGANDPFGAEYHCAALSPAPALYPAWAGSEFRAIGAWIAHDPARWGSDSYVTCRAAQHTFSDGDNDPRLIFDLRPGQNVVQIVGKPGGSEPCPTFLFNSNNVQVARQINAARNAFIPLGYINAADYEEHRAPQYCQASPKVDALFGTRAVRLTFAEQLRAGDAIEALQATFDPGVAAGDLVYAWRSDISSTRAVIVHQLAASGGGGAAYDVTNRGGGGPAEYRVEGLKVVGARQPAIGDAVPVAAAPSAADHNALVATLNAALAMLRSHGLIAA